MGASAHHEQSGRDGRVLGCRARRRPGRTRSSSGAVNQRMIYAYYGSTVAAIAKAQRADLGLAVRRLVAVRTGGDGARQI